MAEQNPHTETETHQPKWNIWKAPPVWLILKDVNTQYGKLLLNPNELMPAYLSS